MDLFFRNTGMKPGEAIADGPGENKASLQRGSEKGTDTIGRHIGCIPALYENRSGIRRPGSREQPRKCSLSTATFANDCRMLSGMDGEGEMLQNRDARLITKAEVLYSKQGS